MNKITSLKKKSVIVIVYISMIVLGIISGTTEISFLHKVGFIISEIFIKMFKCISLPIIALSLIVTLSRRSEEKVMNKLWQQTIFYTITTTLIAASVACGLYLLITPKNIALQTKLESSSAISSASSYWKYISDLIPANFFAPFLEHQVMSVLLVSIVVGLAIRHIPEREVREATTHFFKGLHGLLLVITRWIVSVIPLALYGFITVTVSNFMHQIDMQGLSSYLMVIVLANLVQGFVILPLFLTINGIKPFATLRGMLPALLMAFFSKSSTGTLPITMTTAENNLHISPKVSRLILPLCTSINMNGCAAFIFTTVIYLLQNNGIEINLLTMISWIFISSIAAIGNAGIPMGCFFLSASLLTSMNIPITLLGIILPFYSLIDMVETSLNVWSDSCITKIIAHKLEKHELL